MAMISLETETSELFGTPAYLAQRDVLDMLCQLSLPAQPQTGFGFNFAAAHTEAAEIVAVIPEEFQSWVTSRLQEQVTSVEERAVCPLACGSTRIGGDPLA